MKTYFNYEGQINSKDVAEAIAFPIGIGPFMGFGSSKIEGSTITLYPKSSTTDENPSPYTHDINDRVLARNVSLKDGTSKDGTSLPTFGLINRTGHIWVSTQAEITIEQIRGTQGAWNEVLVFAVFQNIESPVLNKPTFVAYWNSSAQSFYEYWKKSIDSSYGSLGSTLEPWETKISFTDLDAKVKSAVDTYNNTKTMVLIGIYGSGTDVNTNNLENFALIPYSGQFPQSVPFTLDYYYKLKRAIESLDGFVRDGMSGFSSVKNYIDSKLGDQSSTGETPGTIPIGGIILWSGETIPDGWAICNGSQGTPNLQGKFVLATGGNHTLGETGGQEEYTLTMNNIPQHKHQIYFQEYKWGDNANRRPFPSNTQDSSIAGEDPTFSSIYTQDAGQASPTPVPTVPPYYVLYYIMRIR